MTTALEMTRLGRRYGRRWVLRDCTAQLPQGRVIGLVGPNGAGKTTLLHLAVGLLRPTSGSVTVLGRPPGSPEVRSRVGFVAQDKPLYRTLTVAETLHMGGWLNPHFDRALAERRLSRLDIPLHHRAGKLSGGQHAQVALALALGKRPDLLLLDEPVSNLDPLAHREFLRTLMEDVAERGSTVVLSSHVIADLERVCDYIVLLSQAHVQLSGDVEHLLSEHQMLCGPTSHLDALAAHHTIVHADPAERQTSLLARVTGPIHDPTFTVRPPTLEELVLGYMSTPDAAIPPPLRLAPTATQVPA
ncbi:MAG TPA: ABC transporter ATP-binding protein [Rugosimonospora sp.]|nr:ABC transporter ATP-binding protein [Rugosimonospora sp.]